MFLPIVHFFDRIEDAGRDADLNRLLRQRPHVFREATAAISDTGEQEREPDPVVMADAMADFVDVRPDTLADVRHLVDETDLGSQHRVRHVFGEFGAFGRHGEKRSAGPQQRRIERAQRFGDRRPTHADDDTVGIHEVVDRRPFLQELGIARDIAIAAGQRF